MTDRHSGYVVTLAEDVREDEVYTHEVITALQMVKGVVSVEPIVSDVMLTIAENRARFKIAEKFQAFYEEILGRK